MGEDFRGDRISDELELELEMDSELDIELPDNYLEEIEDSNEIDEAFEIDLELEEDEEIDLELDSGVGNTPLLQSTEKDAKDLVEAESEERKALSVKRKAKVAIQENVKKTVRALEGIETSCRVAISRLDYSSNTKRLERELTIDAPDFLTQYMTTFTRKHIDMVDGQDINKTKELFNMLGLPEEKNNIYYLNMFHAYVHKVKKDSYLLIRDRQEFNEKSKNQTLEYIMSLLANQSTLITLRDADYREKELTLATDIVLGEDIVRFRCGHCGEEQLYNGRLFSLIKVDDDRLSLVSPMLCGNCDSINTISRTDCLNIERICKHKAENLRPASNIKSCGDAIVYYPSNLDLCEACPELFSIERKEKDRVEEESIDWQTCVADFREIQRVYRKASKSDSGKIGLSNLVKILANQADNYIELKEKAVASFIQELSSAGLYMLTTEYRESVKIPMYYKSKFEDFYEAIASNIPTRLDLSKNFTAADLKEDFEKYCEYANNFDEHYDKIIKELISNAYFYSNIPISNLSISKENALNYLTEPRLRDAIDYISDLMILGHLGEDYLNFYKPKTYDIADSAKNASYESRFNKIKNVKYLGKLKRSLEKFILFFEDFLETHFNKNIQFNRRAFLLNYTSNYEFFSELCRIGILILDGDYYQAYKKKQDLFESYTDVISIIETCPYYKRVIKLLREMPEIDNNVSKFDYYFPNENFTEEEQEKILDLFVTKKVAPEHLEGNSFEEKYAYFSSLEDFSKIKTFSDKKVMNFINENLILLHGISCISPNINFNDFVIYSLAKDMFIQLSELSVEQACAILFINKDIASIYMDEDFEYPNVEMTKSRLVKYLLFKSKYLRDLVETEYKTDIDLYRAIKSEEDVMLGELEGLQEPTEILKDFFGRMSE